MDSTQDFWLGCFELVSHHGSVGDDWDVVLVVNGLLGHDVVPDTDGPVRR